MKKRIIAMSLVLIMVLTMLPAVPSARTSAADKTLFNMYIPINQAYSASVSPFSVETGKSYSFNIGSRFKDEVADTVAFTELKRKDMQGQFLKISYRGTFGSLNKAEMMETFDINENNYLLAMGDPAGKTYANYKKWITKDTIIVSIALYDAKKNFVRNISTATAIMAAGADGEFLTCSLIQGITCSIFFSTQNNLLKATADVSNSFYAHFTPEYRWLEDKSVAEGLLNAKGSKSDEQTYKFIQHKALTGTPQYMTNNILSVNEFIAPDNTYYQVGCKKDEIDPSVMNKIANIADYSENVVTVSDGVTRRTVLTKDGTLYGVSSNYEKKKLASGVKQAGMYHYLTNNGEVKEIKSGKTIATDCKAFAEHRYGRVIGVLKNDDSFSMGYTYLGEQRYYEKGLTYGGKSNIKTIVPGGVCTKDNKFYRWVEEVKIGGYTLDPATGSFSQSYTLNLKLEYITNNAVRVFPNEYYTGAGDSFNSQTGTTEVAKTGFVENSKGEVWAFGMQASFKVSSVANNGKKTLIRHIFPVYQSTRPKGFDNGNFVGFLPEENNNPFMLVGNHCTNNRPTVNRCGVDYITDVPGGYRALDGYSYAFDNDPDYNSTLRAFQKVPTKFNYLNDSSEMFSAINTKTGTGKVANLHLLPNVARSSYKMDNKNCSTVLLERTDGSMWMSEIYSGASSFKIVNKLGGWECSNAIQITKATKKKTQTVDYIDLVSRKELEKSFPSIKNAATIKADAPKYMESKYYSQVTPGKAEQIKRDGKPFLLIVTKTNCSYSKNMKTTIKDAIEKQKVPVYGCVDNYSSLKFVWNYTKASSLTTPYFVLVKNDKDVTVTSGVKTKAAVNKILKAAKKAGVGNDKIAAKDTYSKAEYPSKKISVDSYEWEVLRYVNRERYKKGLTLLTMPDALQTACNTRENEIVVSYEHTRPNGESPYTTIPNSFKYQYKAENILQGQLTAPEAVSGWMKSKTDRENILNKKFGYIGVGYMNTSPPYWVQMFTDNAGYKSVTTSTGSLKFKSVKAMQNEYLVCTDKNGVKSYMPIDTSSMKKNGSKYTIKLSGKNVTLTVAK